MARKKATPEYSNESITVLKGADRVRKRPAVRLVFLLWIGSGDKAVQSVLGKGEGAG